MSCAGGGNTGFALSREELASKPATVLTALFASLGLPIEYVPRAIRKAKEIPYGTATTATVKRVAQVFRSPLNFEHRHVER